MIGLVLLEGGFLKRSRRHAKLPMVKHQRCERREWRCSSKHVPESDTKPKEG
jgi:hypothetical protein